MSVLPAKTQISLGIRPVWSESSLSAWRNLGSLATHWAHSDDWSDWADAQADPSLRFAHMSFCWFCPYKTKRRLISAHVVNRLLRENRKSIPIFCNGKTLLKNKTLQILNFILIS